MHIYHSHHLIPIHAGGSDDPSNRILLTVAEHAEAHKLLYEKHKNPKDKIAWLGLIGMIDKAEILRELSVLGGSWPWSAESKAKMSISSMGNQNSKGKKRSIEQKAEQSTRQKGKKRKPFTVEHKARLSASAKVKAFSDSHRLNMSISRKGKPQSAETIAKRTGRKRGPYKIINSSSKKLMLIAQQVL